jgi:glutathione S-transferase
MIQLYGFNPAWGLPCVSPFVTKVANFMTMAGIPYEMKPQSVQRLRSESPTGKLPYSIDDGVLITDSTRIVQYLQARHGVAMDDYYSTTDKAVGLAFQRMVEEYTYWSGVIQPRWRHPVSFEMYAPYIVAHEPIDAEMKRLLLAYREKIVEDMVRQGMGLRSDDDVQRCLEEDLDALAVYLGSKDFILGGRPSSTDATVYATIRHIADLPWDWAGRAYVRSKPNLMAYAHRMRESFGI